ncbi:MAG: histidine kinase [Saprospiraceae bacterium]|nr:histidine kinase [Saprospiraceae bacterium]
MIQNSVYSSTETKEGFMWFGTQHGLNRFDGLHFEAIDFTKRADTIMNSKMIVCMHVDKNDNFWLGTTEELVLYDKYKNEVVKTSSNYPGLSLKGNWIKEITTDAQNRLWIRDRLTLWCYDLVNKKMLKIARPELLKNTISLTKSDDEKRIYLATDTSIFVVKEGDYKEIESEVFKSRGLKIETLLSVNHMLWCITSDKKIWISGDDSKPNWKTFESLFGTSCLIDPYLLHKDFNNSVWVGSRSDGVLVADLTNYKVKKSSDFMHQSALRNKFILSFFTNKQGITWVGASGVGVSKYDPAITQFELFRNDALPGKTQKDNMIFSLYSDNGKDFYSGTLTGGLLHWDVTQNQSAYYKPPNQSSNTEVNNIYTITKADDQLLYMATWGGLASFNPQTKNFLLYNDQDGKTQKLASLLKLKGQNKLLVGGYIHFLRYFDVDTKKWSALYDPEHFLENSKIRPRFMHQLNDTEILICSENRCLTKYNFEKGSFKEYPELGHYSGMATHIYVSKKYWWVGTTKGLMQMDAQTEKLIKVWNVETGLSDDVIYSVLEDNYGKIWVGTNKGLNVIEPKTGLIKKFDEKDGLQSLEFNTASCFKDDKGNLYFGGVNGFNKIPAKLLNTQRHNPKPIITNIQVMNEPLLTDSMISYTAGFSLPPNKNFISFEFQSPNYSQTENIIYRYRLLPIQQEWQLNGNRNFINYTQLTPNDYTFEVQSSVGDLRWSQRQSIRVTILTPWYKTFWFLSLITLYIIGMGIYLYKQRISAIKNKALLTQRINETEMAALKAQMNPHFIFNCINSIDAFIQTNDKYNASIYLNKFAKLIRNILDSSKQNLVPLSTDLETLKFYTELECMRTENKFKTIFDIEEGILEEDILIPPLIIQPYVENAIIHGLKSKNDFDGELKISVSKVDDKLVFEIKDNGIGRVAAQNMRSNRGTSYGMQLSTDRVQLFNDDQDENVIITDLYEDNKAMGTSIKVILKIEN